MLTLEQIFISPGHNFVGHHGRPPGAHPTVEVHEVECVADRGLRGDRFFDHQPGYKGQVALFAAEVFAEMCGALGLAGAGPDALRRNLLVRGTDLNALIGKRFALQGVEFEGVEECRPCHWMDTALAPGAEAWLRGRGGLRCRILTTGWLRCAPVTAVWRGVVLAGGESRRMGRDKALLEVNGEPLWRRQLRVLDEAGVDFTAVVRRPGQAALAAGVPHYHDSVEGAGPLAGLHAALAAGGTGWVAVLAVDMPCIDAAWFRGLRTACGPGVGAIARHAGGDEPLAAIYPAGALPVVARHLGEGRRTLRGLTADLVNRGLLTPVPLPEAERWRTANWNAPRDRTDIVCA